VPGHSPAGAAIGEVLVTPRALEAGLANSYESCWDSAGGALLSAACMRVLSALPAGSSQAGLVLQACSLVFCSLCAA